MSDLYDLLTSIRSHYVDQFTGALEELRGKGHAVIIEPPMLNAAGELAREGALELPARFDLAVEDGDCASPSMFSPGKMLEFAAMAFEGGGLSIEISPFSWDAVRIGVDGDADAVATTLAEWFENAVSAPEGVAESDIQHAAHFLSDPVIEDGQSVAQADLGTVDVDVVVDLFDRLRLAGASRVELSLPRS